MLVKNQQSLLWRIERATLPHVSYVFGTMHVKDQRAFQQVELVYHCVAACDAFAAEFDLAEQYEGMHPHLFHLPAGLTLDQIISAKKYNKIRNVLKKYVKFDIHPLRHQQPIIISNLIEQQLLTNDMPYALDEHLWQYAQSLHKQMFGVETLQAQIEVLRNMSVAQQIQGLLSTVRNFPRYRQHLLKMADWYAQGELVKLYRSTQRSTRALRRPLLYDRNELMATRIVALATAQSTFCAIGAAHLAGQKGVLRLLKQQDFRVHAVPFKIPAE